MELLKRVGIPEQTYKYPSELSGARAMGDDSPGTGDAAEHHAVRRGMIVEEGTSRRIFNDPQSYRAESSLLQIL